MTIKADIHEENNRVVIEIADDYLTPTYHCISFSFLNLDLQTAVAHLNSLCNHIRFVREAGEIIGVHPTQLKEHDESKWSPAEFPYYAMKFHSNKSPVDDNGVSDNFARAWLHHIHHNPHHWQHWIFSDGYTPKHSNIENGVVEMPNIYAKEMIADWMGASMAYTGSFDMTDWLYKNMPKIKVHSKTAVYLRKELDALGYADIVYMQRFGNENE